MVGSWLAISLAALVGMGSVQSVATGTGGRLSWSGMPRSPQQINQETQQSGLTPVLTQYLAQLRADGMDSTNHGVWVQWGDQHLGSYQGTVPRSAASLTKVATSLAALEKWGVQHRFETKFWTDGQVQADRLMGNLIVQGGGDPFFVWETAIAVGQELNALGIREVTGDVVLTGRFNMNFLPDPQDPDRFPPDYAGELLRVALDAERWTPPVEKGFETVPDQTKPRVKIAGEVRLLPQVQPSSDRATLLLTRRSLPLVELLKLMNVHSNNAMAEQLADQLGGGPTIARALAESMDFPANEIQLINGSGLGVDNKISPRAANALVLRLTHQLRYPANGAPSYTLADVFPISGINQGSIRDRKMPTGSTVKTGTLNAVSALAGLLPTQTHNTLSFAIINGGLPRILRLNQDRLLQTLQGKWGKPTPLPAAVTPTQDAQGRIMGDPNLGDRQRNIIPVPPSPVPQER